MKVLLANKFFFLNGGSETVFFQEREYLRNNGVEVVDFSMSDPRNFPSVYQNYFVANRNYSSNPTGSFNKIKTSISFIHSSEAIVRLKRLIRDTQPKIAHLHNIYHQITPAIIHILKDAGVKVLLTLHDGKLVCPSYLMLDRGQICTRCQGSHFYNAVTTGCSGSFIKGSLLAIESYWHRFAKSYEKVDLFISPSKFLAEIVSQYRIESSKISILPNGIDIDYFRPQGRDEGYALFFGRISKEKGINTLIAAHEQIDPAFPLKIIGTGPDHENLAQKHPNVTFLGYKQPDKLLPIIANSSFVVVPSEWYENCSMTILESMALAKPVIASNIGGIPEQVVHGETGFLYEMGNVDQLSHYMQRLVYKKNLRTQLGAAARLRAEKEFSASRHCNKLLKIYYNLAKEG